MIKRMNAEELKKRLAKGEVLLIDVRELSEHQAERIEGAHLIPLGSITHEKLPSKSLPVVVHCHAGKRSEEACKKLLEQDPTLDIYTLEGGITSWKTMGGQIKNDSKILPINRQVFLAMGSLIVMFTVLGWVLSPWFYLLVASIGLGMMQSGLTGWCGMERLISRMPWNKRGS